MAELTGSSVRLTAEGRLRTVSVTSLIGIHQLGEDLLATGSADLWTISAVVMAGLTTRQRDALAQRLRALRGLVEPEHGDDRSVSERYASTATELGVTRRTLERQLARLKEHGPAGLVDVRKLREVRRSVDPRWDAICLEVLSSHVNGSNPTKQSVIDQTNRRFVHECPDGALPSRAGAYRRLDELDKGRYTFGGRSSGGR